eukprot:m.188430 g.188430  ORF g.188430 m.188430 type:complete len:102 (+) comp18528_c0_seq8:650-955(+)
MTGEIDMTIDEIDMMTEGHPLMTDVSDTTTGANGTMTDVNVTMTDANVTMIAVNHVMRILALANGHLTREDPRRCLLEISRTTSMKEHWMKFSADMDESKT